MSEAAARPTPETEDAKSRAKGAVELLIGKYGADYAEWYLLYCLGQVRIHKNGEGGGS